MLASSVAPHSPSRPSLLHFVYFPQQKEPAEVVQASNSDASWLSEVFHACPTRIRQTQDRLEKLHLSAGGAGVGRWREKVVGFSA